MSEKLKPCPFCGSEAKVRQTAYLAYEGREYGYGGYFVMCNECMTSSNNYSSEQAAQENT